LEEELFHLLGGGVREVHVQIDAAVGMSAEASFSRKLVVSTKIWPRQHTPSARGEGPADHVMATQTAPVEPAAPSPTLSALKGELYSEGSVLTAALPLELGEALVGSTLQGDGALAAAMRLKFFGELELLNPLPDSDVQGGARAGSHSIAAAGTSAAARRPDGTPEGARRESSGVSQLMREVDVLLEHLPVDMARQVIISILEDESPVAAKLRERLVLLLLAARPAPAASPTRATAAQPAALGQGDESSSGPTAADARTESSLLQDTAALPTPTGEEKDEILEFNISRSASRSITPYTQRFTELMNESRSFFEELPDTPVRSILGAALDGESLLAAAVREQLYYGSPKPPPTSTSFGVLRANFHVCSTHADAYS
jgi:hypothetical protein